MEDLRERLASLEEAHATLEAELAAFRAEYLRVVGGIAAEADALRARWLRRRAEHSGDEADVRAAGAAEEHSRRTTAEAEAVPSPGPPPPEPDLKRLFREAAKRMHPDLATSEHARAHAEAFMKRLTAAYRDGDSDVVADLVRQWEASPYGQAAGEPAPGLAAATLRAAVVRAEDRLAAARRTPLAVLMEATMAAAARGEDLLARMREQAMAERDALRERLAATSR